MQAPPCIQIKIRHLFLRETLSDALSGMGYSVEPLDHGWPRNGALVLATDRDMALTDCAVMTGCAMLVIVLLLHDSEIRRRQYENAGAICIGAGTPLSTLVSVLDEALAKQPHVPIAETYGDQYAL